MKVFQIALLSLLVVWQAWTLSATLGHEYDLRPLYPASPWLGESADPELTARPGRPVQLGTLMSAAVFSPTRQLRVKPMPKPQPVAKEPVRQPVAVKPPAPVKPQPVRPGLQLEGVLMSSSQQMALLREVDTEDRKWIGLGEKFKGWTLIEISALEIVVESGKHRSILPLYVDNR